MRAEKDYTPSVCGRALMPKLREELEKMSRPLPKEMREVLEHELREVRKEKK